MSVDFKVLQAGYCTQSEWIAVKGGGMKKIIFPSVVALISHPQKGMILFDTGYAPRIYDETKNFPLKLFAKAIPVVVQEEDSVVNQLKRRNISPEQINYVIVSHFHADHLGGLKDFPSAEFICIKESYDFAKNIPDWQAAKHGIVKKLIPNDFEERTTFLSEKDINFNNHFLPPFAVAHDLWGDETMILVPLEGHFRGQTGLLVNKKNFMIADACWLRRSYIDYILPSPIAYFMMDNVKLYQRNLKLIHEFYKSNPDVNIIPTHCLETFESLKEN